jgi:hypothetical protein
MNSWIKGLQDYNKGKDSWCIPRKGSKGYNEIMSKKKPVPTAFMPEKELFSEPTKTVIPKKPYTFKGIQEMRAKGEKFARETSRLTRNESKKLLGIGKYGSNRKEDSTPIDFTKDKIDLDQEPLKIKKKRSGVIL